jgi:hypothetical protein
MSRLERIVLATIGLLAAFVGAGFVLEAAFEAGNPVRGLGYLAGGAFFLWASLRLYRRTQVAG